MFCSGLARGQVQTQSPQLRESDPTFWILNAVVGICATPPTPILAPALVSLALSTFVVGTENGTVSYPKSVKGNEQMENRSTYHVCW
jgi:ABC-type methionine transport system permease subunit